MFVCLLFIYLFIICYLLVVSWEKWQNKSSQYAYGKLMFNISVLHNREGQFFGVHALFSAEIHRKI